MPYRGEIYIPTPKFISLQNPPTIPAKPGAKSINPKGKILNILQQKTENFIDFILSCSSAVRSSFSFTCKWNDLKKYALPWKMPCSYGIE